MVSLRYLLSILHIQKIKLAARGAASLDFLLKCFLNIWCLLLSQMAKKKGWHDKHRKGDTSVEEGWQVLFCGHLPMIEQMRRGQCQAHCVGGSNKCGSILRGQG